MVKHIVVYKLKDGVDKVEAAGIAASAVEPLVGRIPGLLFMQIRPCYQGMEIMRCTPNLRAERLWRPMQCIPCIWRQKRHFTISLKPG